MRNPEEREKSIQILPAQSHPRPSSPVAYVNWSGQHPNSLVEQSSQPSKLEPSALVSPSGQQPNSVACSSLRF